ncbi:hypothetical protein DAI22_02g230200 [Oryza sativa Japonica Group]|nr:hypothetical protein DAI22_02g230200 [Oryza sativa Japonica Group]
MIFTKLLKSGGRRLRWVHVKPKTYLLVGCCYCLICDVMLSTYNLYCGSRDS